MNKSKDEYKFVIMMVAGTTATMAAILGSDYDFSSNLVRKETPHVCTDSVFILRVGDDLECDEDQNLSVKDVAGGVVVTCICKPLAVNSTIQ